MLTDALPVSCGQCMPCRIKRRRLWVHRMVLESLCYEAGQCCFLTLTYSPECLPVDGNLSTEHFTLWLKRFRRALDPVRIRYFGVGEYGDLSWRPHYHLCVFGVGPECQPIVDRTWNYAPAGTGGFVAAYEFNMTTAQYTAGYVVKKMTAKDDWRLDGRTPEFFRVSRNPGIGAPATELILDAFEKNGGADLLSDVPMNLKLGRSTLILGRYLRKMLRDQIGFSDEYKEALKQNWVSQKDEEMFPLRLLARDSKEATARQLLVEKNMGKIWSAEARAKLKQRGTL